LTDEIKAGSFVKQAHGDPDLGNFRVGIVMELSTNDYSDGTSETWAHVAWLPTHHCLVDTLTPYTTGGSAPVEPAVPSRAVTSSTSEAAASVCAPVTVPSDESNAPEPPAPPAPKEPVPF
jgi:hypothetical protein